MSFLSSIFLLALPLAALPLLLHLFDRQRNVVIEWGAMQFLAEAASRRTNARRLKQWLLLLLRTLAVAALVLALARPLLPGNWLSTAKRSETILVLDNSMSMMRHADAQVLFDRALARALDEVDRIAAGDFARVLLASPYPTWVTTGSVRIDSASRQALKEDLLNLRPTSGSSDVLAALFAAAQAELQLNQRERRIVLVTDGQKTDWAPEDEAGWSRLHEVLSSASIRMRVDVVNLAEQASSAARASNLSVVNLRANRTLAGVNQPIRFTARISNHGPATAPAGHATWHVVGQNLQESQVPALAGDAEHDVVWQHSFGETGVYSITCRLDADDPLAPDNEATLVVEVVDRAAVLVVESAPSLAEIQQDSFFVQAALGWIDGQPLEEASIYAPTVIEPEALSRTALNDYRAIVIPNLVKIEKDTVEQLQRFVADGGGLWIGLGPRTDVEMFNHHLFADGNGLAPLAIDQLVDAGTQAKEGTQKAPTIDPFVSEHPATISLGDHQRLDLGNISASQHFRFSPPPQGESSSVLLSFDNGEALAVEGYYGDGRVIVQGVPLRLQWSELVRSQAFVVMVQDWLEYLAQPRATRHNLEPGDPIAVAMTDNESRQATLHTPHGDAVELTADDTGHGLVFRSTRTLLPGNYRLDVGITGTGIPFHVRRDPRESDLRTLSVKEQRKLTEVPQAIGDSSPGDLSGVQQRDPVWPLLLMMLIGLITAELALSGFIARERFGLDPIAEANEWAVDATVNVDAKDEADDARHMRHVFRNRETITN